MFVLGFILGLLVAAGAVWLLLQAGRVLYDAEFTELVARKRIGDLERAAIQQMLSDAQASAERPERSVRPAGPGDGHRP